MKNQNENKADRLGGLRRFAIAITVLNILGHTVLGFEQAWITPVIAVATAYATELLLEIADARMSRRKPRFLGGLRRLADFLLSAHISGLAVGMLLYANSRPGPVMFAAACAICSKAALRLPGENGRHFLNPSNFGITVTLLLFPWVGIAPPYQFTEKLDSPGDFLLPGIIIASGTFLNYRFTKRLPLIAAWLSCFALQAALRHLLFDTRIEAALAPMTGVAFILFTFYMVTDPATTPESTAAQVMFGAATAFLYGLLMVSHIVFGLFFALTIVCVGRGLAAWSGAWRSAAVAPARAVPGAGVEEAVLTAAQRR